MNKLKIETMENTKTFKENQLIQYTAWDSVYIGRVYTSNENITTFQIIGCNGMFVDNGKSAWMHTWNLKSLTLINN